MKQAKLLLTPAEAAYLQTIMPKHFSIQPIGVQGKRIRSAKKLDDQFTDDFTLATPKTIEKSNNNHKKCDKDHQLEKTKVPTPKKQTTIVENKEQTVKVDEVKSRSERIMTTFLLKLKMHKSSWPFRMPVDPVSQAVPNYYDVVKEPMDLKTIDKKIKAHQYLSQKDFDRDIRLVIANSYAFNSQDTVYYALTKEFQNYYEVLYGQYRKNPEKFAYSYQQKKDIEDYKEVQIAIEVSPQKKPMSVPVPEKKRSSAKKKTGQIYSQTSKQKLSSPSKPQIEKQTKTIESKGVELNFKQRQHIFHQIQKLSQTGIRNLCKLIKGKDGLQGDWQQFELDLNEIDNEKYTKLLQFLSNPQKPEPKLYT